MVTDVASAIVRRRGRILLARGDGNAEGDGDTADHWGVPTERVEDDEDPAAAARRAVAATGTDVDLELVAVGSPVNVEADDGAGGQAGANGEARTQRIHPVHFEWPSADSSAVGHPDRGKGETTDDDAESAPGDHEWVHPPTILRRETTPGLWDVYERVAPTVRAVAADDEHGSAYVSVRALEVLRDRAGLLAARYGDDPDDWDELADLARRLRTARPSMTAVGNRVDRVMAEADREPGAVERRAGEAVDRAVTADGDAAATMADRLAGATVLTLSRSGTVLQALRRGGPARVFVAESRPAREGVAVAEALADETSVVLHTDAAIAHVLATEPVDCVVVGADAVRPDGGVVNKTGTRVAAVAAAHEGIPTYAVAAADKVATGGVSLESAPGSVVYDGDRPVEARNPTFDETPPDLLAGIATERGLLDTDEVADLAAALRRYAAWDEGSDDGSGDPTG